MAINSSSIQNLDSRSRGGTEPKKKMKKLRSIKISKLPSLKPCTRRAKSRFDWPPIDLSSDNSSPKHLSLLEWSDASPNYMKATSCSDAKKESSQGGNESDDISFSSSTHGSVASMPLSKNQNGRIRGGTDLEKTLKKSKSNKLVNFGSSRPSRRRAKSRFDCEATLQQPSSVEVSDASPNYLKETNYSDERNDHFQASPHNSESSSGSSYLSKRSSHYSQSNSASSGQKSMKTLARTSSLRTVRILKNKTSFKSKKPSMKNCSEISHDLSIDRATCSSTLKDLKLPEQIELHTGESKSERISLMKVCPYHHCSLNGHCNAPAPPLKRLLTKRRRSLMTQKSMKHKIRFTIGKERSGDIKEKDQASQIVAASNVGNENAGFCLPALSLKPANQVSTCSEEVLNLNSELCEDGSSSMAKRSIPDDFKEATEDNGVTPSASKCDPLKEHRAARQEKNGGSDTESEFVGGFTTVRDSEPNASAREAFKTRFIKEKNISMWHLIHQQMVSGLAAQSGTQPIQGADKEEQVIDANTLPAREGSGLSPDFSSSDMGVENDDADNKEIDLRKIYAIKLVREAIEKILLPEVQDRSPDDQSSTSDVISDQEPLEKNHGEGGETSISTSTDFVKNSFRECDNNKMEDDVSLDPKGVSPAADNISAPEEEKATTKVGNKSDKQTPKSWSNLKKWILLKRFIKALEKVRQFNPRKPRDLQLEPETEAEKVCLRHQMMNERKNLEEWMLDYALQQAVSQLAPTQKRKVALLVKAFETVVPPQEYQHIQVAFPKHKHISQESHCLKSDDIVSSCDNVPVNEKANKVCEDTISSLNSKLVNDCSKSGGKTVELDGLSGATDEPSYITNSSTPDGDGQSTAAENVASSAYDCDQLERLTTAREEKNERSEPERVVIRGFPPLIGSEPDCTANGAKKTQLDRQNYIRMWHMVYQHVASGIAAKVGTQLLLDGADEEEKVDDGNTSPEIETSGSCRDYSKTDHDAGKENHDANHQRIEFSQSDAVKLVQEAVDEILLPEIQDDSSDTQSITSDTIPDQELLEKNQDDGGEQRILTSIDSTKDSCREYDKGEVEGGNIMVQEEKGSEADSMNSPEERAISMIRKHSDQKKPKNWTKLKKLILLKRSIKALEKSRKLNSQPPQYIPLKHDPEAEKVDLRQQMMDERKKAEQWMLDYAVQHIVTKLTPARKRRVAMLVEAFEAVVPLPEI